MVKFRIPGARAARVEPRMRRRRTAVAAVAAMLVAASCGGPAGAPANQELATDDVAYLTRLGRIRGRSAVAVELYRAGRRDDAAVQAVRPADALYAGFAGTFAARGVERFDAELDAFASAVAGDPSREAVDSAYDALVEAIARAGLPVEEGVASDAEAQAAIVLGLLETAAEAYAQGVADGRVADRRAYQRAYGLTLAARERAEQALTRVIVRHDHAVLQRIVEAVDGLPMRFWPALAPSAGIDVEPADFHDAVERIRTEAERI